MRRFHLTTAVLLAGLAFGPAGCSKEEPAPQATLTPKPGTTREVPSDPAAASGTGITNPLEVPGAYVEAVVGAKFDAEKKAHLLDMRQRITAFEVTNDRKPKDLQEAAMGAPLPKLPAGAEWRYDPRTGDIDIVSSEGK